MKTVTINVTEDHIKRGKPQEPCHCPIALAICERLRLRPDAGNIVVDANEIDFLVPLDADGMTDRTTVPISSATATDFIETFDDNGEVEPFSFELDVPDELAD